MDFDHPPPDPIKLFSEWFDEAKQTALPNPNAMSLATVDPDGRPSCRIVLLKGFDERGAVFFTNHHSRKGKALLANPHAAVTFHWDPLDRQVRIEGAVTQTTDAESDAYFAMRPRGSRIGAWASQQSEPASSRASLEEAMRQYDAQYPGEAVPRPPHWGGFRVALDRIEFWQGQRDRLHDRIVYTMHDDSWKAQRLQP